MLTASQTPMAGDESPASPRAGSRHAGGTTDRDLHSGDDDEAVTGGDAAGEGPRR